MEHRETVARDKRRAYRDQEYWGRPVPGFGDPNARLLIVGLAPGAHGANRTGRVFTGDRSGEFLYRALYEAGFANQPDSTHRDDGLRLTDCYITSPVRCAPPANKPTPEEIATCSATFLDRELFLLPKIRVVLVLGRIALEGYRRVRGLPPLAFAHGLRHDTAPPIVCSYHVSQQNTQTGRLTQAMFAQVLQTARRIVMES